MRSPRQTPSSKVRLVRSLLAVALACLVVAASVPAGAVSAARGCPMPCCQGQGGGAGGHCEGGSCHVNLFKPAPPPEHAPSDPMCGTSHGAAAHGTAAHDAAATAGHEHAEHADAHGHLQHAIEHGGPQGVSPRDTAPRAPAVSASVSKPCPPECGALSNSFTQPRPSRDGAALAHGLRPRPPSAVTLPRARTRASKTSTELRGRCSPRAPPAPSSVA